MILCGLLLRGLRLLMGRAIHRQKRDDCRFFTATAAGGPSRHNVRKSEATIDADGQSKSSRNTQAATKK